MIGSEAGGHWTRACNIFLHQTPSARVSTVSAHEHVSTRTRTHTRTRYEISSGERRVARDSESGRHRLRMSVRGPARRADAVAAPREARVPPSIVAIKQSTGSEADVRRSHSRFEHTVAHGGRSLHVFQRPELFLPGRNSGVTSYIIGASTGSQPRACSQPGGAEPASCNIWIMALLHSRHAVGLHRITRMLC